MASETTPQLWRWLLVELGIGAAAFVVTGMLAPELHAIARTASACALLSGLVSLGAIHGLYPRGTNGLFAGIGIGFFVRMILLAVGLVLSHARGDLALTYAFTFFAIFALTQGTEIAYVLSCARGLKAARAP